MNQTPCTIEKRGFTPGKIPHKAFFNVEYGLIIQSATGPSGTTSTFGWISEEE
ncbi:toxin cluster protein 2 [Sesbania bispinosa]|nr:toxin cluster protein 2 [Sesbania bispinosa]